MWAGAPVIDTVPNHGQPNHLEERRRGAACAQACAWLSGRGCLDCTAQLQGWMVGTS
jgi:hypothetical protein